MTQSGLILVVDNNHDDLTLILESLSELAEQGIELAVEDDGARAVEQALQNCPDLILMDVQMPGMDGFEVCARLKADPSMRDIPVIFMTSLSDSVSRVRGLRLGASDYVTKPCQREELLARVRMHLKLRFVTKALGEQNARLKQEVEERVAVEGELQKRTQQLEDTNARLQIELVERERSDRERIALQQEIICVQSARLAEMATPLIPLTRGIMVMPLIGSLDAERAQQVLATALRGVHQTQAKVVILDITGVRRVDSAVASTLVGTTNALRLLGARALITGIGAEVARALVDLGILLDTIETFGTLQSGIAYAMRRSTRSE